MKMITRVVQLPLLRFRQNRSRYVADRPGDDMDLAASPLLTDLYQLNMIQAYLDHGETKAAVFEFFVRKLPARRGFLVAAGLEQALDFLENLRFPAEELGWLNRAGGLARTSLITSLAFASPATCTPCRKAQCSSPMSPSCA